MKKKIELLLKNEQTSDELGKIINLCPQELQILELSERQYKIIMCNIK